MQSARDSYKQGDYFESEKHGLLKVEKLLGSGSYGQVYLVSDAKNCYALKRQSSISQSERAILERLRDAGLNLVRTIEIFERQGSIFVLMERCQRSLLDRIRETGTVTNDEFRYMFSQIAKGLKELHEMNIIHSDIKPENILEFIIQEGQRRQVTYKICDFGVSSTEYTTNINVGTPYYMAPEQFQGKYDQKVDIFALGCVMYEVVSGKILFNGKSRQDVENAIKSINPVNQINNLVLSDKFKQLIINMTNKDPIKRYTIDQVVNELKPEIKRSPPKTFQPQKQQEQNKPNTNIRIIKPNGTHIKKPKVETKSYCMNSKQSMSNRDQRSISSNEQQKQIVTLTQQKQIVFKSPGSYQPINMQCQFQNINTQSVPQTKPAIKLTTPIQQLQNYTNRSQNISPTKCIKIRDLSEGTKQTKQCQVMPISSQISGNDIRKQQAIKKQQ